MKLKKQPALAHPFDNIRASACPMVAFSGFYESHKPPPSGNARGIVPPHRDGNQNGNQSGYMLHCCFVCCHPNGRRGDTERVVTQWQRLVTFIKALDFLHQLMRLVLHQRTAIMAIEMACDGGAFVPRRRLF
jgi:hypothetical protein